MILSPVWYDTENMVYWQELTLREIYLDCRERERERERERKREREKDILIKS